MRIEWVFEAIAAVGIPAFVVWGSLRLLPRAAGRLVWLPWSGLGLGSAALGSAVGVLLTFLAWRLAPGTDSCTGCEMGWGLIGFAAAVGGGAIGFTAGLWAGHSVLDSLPDGRSLHGHSGTD